MKNIVPIVKKELREMSRDTTLPVLIIIMIIVTLITTISGSEIESLPTVIIRNDYSEYSTTIIDSIKSDKFFWVQQEISDKTYSYQLLKTKKTFLVIDIPSTLGSDISAGRGEITLIYEADVRKEANVALLHLQKILGDLNQQMLKGRLQSTSQILSQGVEEVDQIPPLFNQVENSLTTAQESILKLGSELSSGGEIESFKGELEEIGSELSQAHLLIVDVGTKMNNAYTQLNDPAFVTIIPTLPPEAQQSYTWAVGNTSEAIVESATADRLIVSASRKLSSLSISVESGKIDFTELTNLNNELSSVKNQLNLILNRILELKDIFIQTNKNLLAVGNIKISIEEKNSEIELRDTIFAVFIPVLVWMISMLVSVRSLANERAHGTLKRLITAPISLWELITGKFIALNIVLSIVPPISVILLAIYILGMRCIGDVLLVALIYMFISMNAVSIGIMISSMTTSERRALELLGLVIGGSLPLVGFITPSEAMSPIARLIEHLTPISYFTNLSRAVMIRGDADIWGYLLVPFIFTIIYFILSGLFLEREVKSA